MLIAAFSLALAAQAVAQPAPALPERSPMVLAANTPSAGATPTPAPAPADPAEPKTFCRYVRNADTMIGGRKECHTAAVWTRMAHEQ